MVAAVAQLRTIRSRTLAAAAPLLPRFAGRWGDLGTSLDTLNDDGLALVPTLSQLHVWVRQASLIFVSVAAES